MAWPSLKTFRDDLAGETLGFGDIFARFPQYVGMVGVRGHALQAIEDQGAEPDDIFAHLFDAGANGRNFGLRQQSY